jgi:hypothetical protein
VTDRDGSDGVVGRVMGSGGKGDGKWWAYGKKGGRSEGSCKIFLPPKHFYFLKNTIGTTPWRGIEQGTT